LKSCLTLTAADSPSCETATILISPRLGLKKRHYSSVGRSRYRKPYEGPGRR